MTDTITIYVDGVPHIKARYDDIKEPAQIAMAMSQHYAGRYVILAFDNGFAGYRNGVRTRIYTYGG